MLHSNRQRRIRIVLDFAGPVPAGDRLDAGAVRTNPDVVEGVTTAGPASVIAMCGLAFSGKSTAARQVAAALGHSLIVLDTINAERGLDGGAGLSIAQWEETSHIAMARLATALVAGHSVVVDDTHSHRILRDRCRAVAERHDAAFTLLHIDTPLDDIARRRERNRLAPTRPHIADHVFAAHRDGFEMPTDDDPGLVRISDDAALRRWIAAQPAPMQTP